VLIVLLWVATAAGALALVFLVTVAVQIVTSAGQGRRVARIEVHVHGPHPALLHTYPGVAPSADVRPVRTMVNSDFRFGQLCPDLQDSGGDLL
jgi:hypothetical protein